LAVGSKYDLLAACNGPPLGHNALALGPSPFRISCLSSAICHH